MLISPYNNYCLAWDRIYVKSNGRIPCWCDAGEPFTILQTNPQQDFVTDVVNSPQMREMRLKTLQDQQPYNTYCQNCCFFHTIGRGRNFRHKDHKPETSQSLSRKIDAALHTLHKVVKQRQWPLGSIDEITEIQFEPSFACNLRCPGCLHGWHPAPMQSEEKPYVMPYEHYAAILDSLQNHHIKVRKISYIGRGEPTLNKQFPQMLTLTRELFPKTLLSFDTNATQEFQSEYLLADWIHCSIDGSTEESYAGYRYGGEFLRTIRFMRTAVYHKMMSRAKCQIIWKYILFDHTAKEHLLNQAQQMALNLGIDELQFIITPVGSYDGSITPSQTTIGAMEDYIRRNDIFHNTTIRLS